MNNIKVAVIVPDRNDRPDFLKNCIRMIEAQTRKPEIFEIVNYEAECNDCDITTRYKIGYANVSRAGADCVLFMENDDWYSDRYIEFMVSEWVSKGQPNLLGHQYTIYYHLGLRKVSVFHHMHRSSAMNTLIKAGESFGWGSPKNPYTDSYLWTNVYKNYNWSRVTVTPPKLICLGMKHNVGKVGGEFHSTGLDRFKRNSDVTPPSLLMKSLGNAWWEYSKVKLNGDQSLDYLRRNIDEDSFDFYSKISDRLKMSSTFINS